jgi:hypothetical protein
MEGFRKKCMGNIGSLVVLYVTHVSYSPKMANNTMPVVSVPIMTPLLHSCETPASCKANIRGIGQQTDRTPPGLSRLRIRSVFDLPSFQDGRATNNRIIAIVTTGPLLNQL